MSSADWKRRREVLVSWLIFVVTLVVLLTILLRFGGLAQDSLTDWTAWTTAWALTLLGAEGHAQGSLVSSSLMSLRIILECTAVFPCMLFFAAVLAYPCGLKAKSWGIAFGIPSIVLINQVRLVSLFYVGRWFPEAFDTVHLVVWQSLIIFLTLVLWLLWAVRVAGRPGRVRA